MQSTISFGQGPKNYKGPMVYGKFLIIFINCTYIFTGNNMETHYTCTPRSSTTNTTGKPSKRPVPALLPLAKNTDSEDLDFQSSH